MAVKIQLRGDTKANWLLTNPVISEREIVLETDTGKYKIGDGVAHYVDISYHGIDGKPSRITADGFWEIYSPATDTYGKTEYKALGVDGKSAFELWQALEGNADKTVEEYLIAIKGQDGQSAYLDAVAKGYAGTKDEFDTLLAGIGVGGADVYIADWLDPWGSATITQNQFDQLKSAVVDLKIIILSGAICTSCYINEDDHGIVLMVQQLTNLYAISIAVDLSVQLVELMLLTDAESDGESRNKIFGRKNGNWAEIKAIIPTDVETLTSLSSLLPTKYSQKYTYTSTTAQGINFASTPEEGFECMLDIKNGTSSQITQAIPNSAAWQCEETSLVIPAGKVGSISIRYVHGKYCVRVGL